MNHLNKSLGFISQKTEQWCRNKKKNMKPTLSRSGTSNCYEFVSSVPVCLSQIQTSSPPRWRFLSVVALLSPSLCHLLSTCRRWFSQQKNCCFSASMPVIFIFGNPKFFLANWTSPISQLFQKKNMGKKTKKQGTIRSTCSLVGGFNPFQTY